jgi:hypothetical protein
MDSIYQYSGIIHIHSTYSDGSKSIPEIAAIANELDFDFLLFTDHNTLKPKFDNLEGWYGNILVGIGCEINDSSDLNHYLAFDIDKEVSNEIPPKEYISEVKMQGGFGIIAHPDEKRTAMPEYPPFPWTVWDSEEFDGIEIWNQMSEWMEGLTHRNKYWRVLHPRKSILAPTKETLKKWDEINLKRKVLGIGGVDAHAHIYKFMGLFQYRIFRYKVIFKTLRTHLLLREPLSKNKNHHRDLSLIYDAMRNANCFISNYYLGDAKSFNAWVDNGDRSAIIGESIIKRDKTILYVDLPIVASIHVIHNGEKIAVINDKNVEYKMPDIGIYRLEIYQGKRPWIYTNHFRITQP